MAIIIKLNVAKNGIPNVIKSAYALAKAGYHGLYFKHNEMDRTGTLIIDNLEIKSTPALKAIFEDLFKTDKLPVTIESISEGLFTPTKEYISYLHMMLNDLERSQHQDGILSDIQFAAIKSAEVIPNLAKKLHGNWEKAHQPKAKKSTNPWDDFGSSIPSPFTPDPFDSEIDRYGFASPSFASSFGHVSSSHSSPFSQASSSMSHHSPHSLFGASHPNNSYASDPFSDSRRKIQEQNERILRESRERDRLRIAQQNAEIARRQNEQRMQIELQNATLSFNHESRFRRETSLNAAHVKAERNLFAAILLGCRAKENNWSEIDIAAHWPSFFMDKDFVNTITINKITSDENAVKLHVDIKNDKRYGFSQNDIDDYYTTAECFYEQLAAILSMPCQAKMKYNLPHCDSFDLDFLTLVSDQAIASFIFDIQLALISTGLLKQFIIQVTLCHSKEYIDNLTFIALMKRYNIQSDDGSLVLKNEQIERMIRMAAANNILADLKFMHEYFSSVDLNNQDSNPASLRTPLHLALERVHVEIVKYLLDSGAKTDIKDAKGNTQATLGEQSNNSEIKFMFHKLKADALEATFRSMKM